MKYLSVLVLSVFLIGEVSARQLSSQEALERVNNSLVSTRGISEIDPNPVLTVFAEENQNFKGVYVYDTHEGYLIVSADDNAVPLLGYTDNKTPINNSISDFMGWLKFYADQIYTVSKSTDTSQNHSLIKSKTRQMDWEAIKPLIATKWGQQAPYNTYAPEINGEKCLAGCVAVTMAQIMNYYKFPTSGKGSHSYLWNNENLSINFEDIDFDWNLMNNTYGADSSIESKEAVAELMYACGVSIDMDYGVDLSGTYSYYIPQALCNYFGYDISMATLPHSCYNSTEWEALIYQQLSEGNPVAYSGQSYQGGHSFICDGYDGNGYFHMNWGFVGAADGYYLLSALDPFGSGENELSNTDTSYNFSQYIIINIKPPVPDSEVYPAIYPLDATYLVAEDENGYYRLYNDDKFHLGSYLAVTGNFGFTNLSCSNLDVTFGLKLTPEKGIPFYVDDISGKISLSSLSTVDSYIVRIPEDIPEGLYKCSTVFKLENGEWQEMKQPFMSLYESSIFSIKDGEVMVYAPTVDPWEVLDFEFLTPVYIDDFFECNITFKNIGTESIYTDFQMALSDEPGNIVAISDIPGILSIEPGEEKTVKYYSLFEEFDIYTLRTLLPGKYNYDLVSLTSGYFLTNPYEIREIEVNAKQNNTEFEASLSIQGDSDKLNTSEITFDVTITCIEGFVSAPVYVIVRPYDGTENKLPHVGFNSIIFTVEEGASKTLPVTVSVEPSEYKTFQAYVGYNFGDNVVNQCSEAVYFTNTYGALNSIYAGNSGIELKMLDGNVNISSIIPIKEINLYSVNGALVGKYYPGELNIFTIESSTLSKGAYLIRITTSDSKTSTYKLML